MLDVFEKINQEVPFNTIRWFLDHAETISSDNLMRVKTLVGGGIAIQDRIAYQGEYFLQQIIYQYLKMKLNLWNQCLR